MYYFFQNPEVKKFCKGKTIVNIQVTRPEKGWFKSEFGPHSNDKVPPQGIRIDFDDDTSLTIDTWIGLYGKDKPPEHKRELAYLTALVRNELGIALLPDELHSHNNGDLKLRIREPTKAECKRIRLSLLKYITGRYI